MGMFKRAAMHATVFGAQGGVAGFRALNDRAAGPHTQTYSKDDVAKMKGAATELLDSIDVHAQKARESIPTGKVEASTLDSMTKASISFLEKIDAKYKDVSPQLVQRRVTEALVSSYLRDNLDETSWRKAGLPDSAMAKLPQIKAQVAAEKAEKADSSKQAFDLKQAGASLAASFTGVQVEADDGKAHEAIAGGLGVDLATIPAKNVDLILEEKAAKATANNAGLRDALKVFSARKSSLASIGVNLARIGEIPPQEFIEAMIMLSAVTDRTADIAMAGKEAFGKLTDIEEVRALLVTLIDAGLQDGDFAKQLADTVGGDAFEAQFKAALDAPELHGLVIDAKTQLDALSAALEKATAGKSAKYLPDTKHLSFA